MVEVLQITIYEGMCNNSAKPPATLTLKLTMLWQKQMLISVQLEENSNCLKMVLIMREELLFLKCLFYAFVSIRQIYV